MHFGRLPGLRVCRAAFSAPDDPLGTVITEPPPMGCAGGVTRQAVRLIAQHDLYISLKDRVNTDREMHYLARRAGRREDGFRGIRPTIVEFAHVVRVVAEDVLVGDHTTPEATHLLDASRARERERKGPDVDGSTEHTPLAVPQPGTPSTRSAVLCTHRTRLGSPHDAHHGA